MIDNAYIPWRRAMDRRVFRYVALAPTGEATRDEIARTFWPNDASEATIPRLRIVCANIRKAFARVVGDAEIEQFFIARPKTLRVNLDVMNVDLRRYIAHARYASQAYATGDLAVACEHYVQALELYSGSVDWDCEEEPWIRPLARDCAGVRAIAIQRLGEMLRVRGLQAEAVKYEVLLASLAPLDVPA